MNLRDETGSEIMEAAIILPLLFLLIMAIFWFGRGYSVYTTLTQAAYQAARAAAVPECAICAPMAPSDSVAQSLYETLPPNGISPLALRRPAQIPALLACTSGKPVACDAELPNVCLQEYVQLTTEQNNNLPVCGMALSFVYPYQLFNKPILMLPGVARVRTENQWSPAQ